MSMETSGSRPARFRDQALVFAGVIAAIITLVVLWRGGFAHALAAPPQDNVASRLAFVAPWLILPALSLLVGLGMVANRRFLTDAIDGTRTPASHSFEINLRYNQNTLEQVVLAAIAWVNLALLLPVADLPLIAGMAVVFALGRALFWIGYLMAPWARAYGLGLTFYPTAVAYGWLVWRLLQGG